MNCLNFICQNDDEEQQIQQKQTKNVYNRRKQMGFNSHNQNNSRIRDERRSLRRTIVLESNNQLQPTQTNFAYPNTDKIIDQYGRPINNIDRAFKKTPITEPILRNSQPQFHNQSLERAQIQTQLIYLQQQRQTQKPMHSIQQHFLNPTIINSQSQYANGKNFNSSRQPQKQNQFTQQIENRTNPQKYESKNAVNVVFQQQKEGLELGQKNNKVPIQQKKMVSQNVQNKQKLVHIQMESDNLLKPMIESQPIGFRNSRCVSNVGHINDIACTKTQSVGSSSDSSSQFSQIVYRINDGSKQKKMTNSSINFVSGSEETKIENNEKKKGSHKAKKSETEMLDKLLKK